MGKAKTQHRSCQNVASDDDCPFVFHRFLSYGIVSCSQNDPISMTLTGTVTMGSATITLYCQGRSDVGVYRYIYPPKIRPGKFLWSKNEFKWRLNSYWPYYIGLHYTSPKKFNNEFWKFIPPPKKKIWLRPCLLLTTVLQLCRPNSQLAQASQMTMTWSVVLSNWPASTYMHIHNGIALNGFSHCYNFLAC